LKLKLAEPGLHSVPGGLLSLSGPALQDFLEVVLARGASFRFRARGFSMHPFIKDGDVITVSPWRGARLHPGDVVAFCQPDTGKLVVHRILAINSQGFLLQGDNNPGADGLAPSAGILGRVARVERNGRIIRLGWGPERRLLALLARYRFLKPLAYWTWQVFHLYLRRNPR
jgi:hypothetical protein